MKDAVHEIFAKYNTALHAVGGSGVIQRETVQLALLLALEEYAAQAPQQAAPAVDQRVAENNAAQIARLNEWLAEHAPSLYASPHDTATCVLQFMDWTQYNTVSRWLNDDLTFDPGHFSGMSTAEAVLCWMELAKARISALEVELATVQGGAAFHSHSPNGNANGNGEGEPARAFDLEELPARLQHEWGLLDKGLTTWRKLPKVDRLMLARFVLAQIDTVDGPPTQWEFNRARPIWMGKAETLPPMFGCTWADLVSDVDVPVNGGQSRGDHERV